MPIRMASLGPKRIIIGLSQEISKMKRSRIGDNQSIMVNYARRPSKGSKRQRRNAPILKDIPSLMLLLGK